MGDDGAPSFWWQQADRVERAALPGPTDADVCVVGAGYTGLWTAYYLARAAPELRVVVVEQRFAGYGASGRATRSTSSHQWETTQVVGLPYISPSGSYRNSTRAPSGSVV